MAKNKFRVVISEYVFELVLDIYRRICYDSLSGAEHVRKELISGMQSLRDFPERYPYYEAVTFKNKQLRKMVVLRRYLIFYEVVGFEVRIYSVVDGKRDDEYLL